MIYKRFPVILSKNAVCLIHVFSRPDHVEDLWIYDEDVLPDHFADCKEQAKQLIDQLEDHWTPAFLMALRDEINRRL